MANETFTADQQFNAHDRLNATDRSETGSRLMDEYLTSAMDAKFPPVGKCVDSTANQFLPGLDLECFKESVGEHDREVELQRVVDLEARMNEAIANAGRTLTNAIESGHGHQSIEMVQLSRETSRKIDMDVVHLQERRPPSKELLQPAEQKVFDYLKSQGLDPWIRSGMNTSDYTIVVSLDRKPVASGPKPGETHDDRNHDAQHRTDPRYYPGSWDSNTVFYDNPWKSGPDSNHYEPKRSPRTGEETSGQPATSSQMERERPQDAHISAERRPDNKPADRQSSSSEPLPGASNISVWELIYRLAPSTTGGREPRRIN